ncbi:MAG: TadE family protein, partial [Acidimicrobiales bacterium]
MTTTVATRWGRRRWGRGRRWRSRGDEGQALVEFILVMPLLVALLAGVLEFGWYINAHNTVASAA